MCKPMQTISTGQEKSKAHHREKEEIGSIEECICMKDGFDSYKEIKIKRASNIHILLYEYTNKWSVA